MGAHHSHLRGLMGLSGNPTNRFPLCLGRRFCKTASSEVLGWLWGPKLRRKHGVRAVPLVMAEGPLFLSPWGPRTPWPRPRLAVLGSQPGPSPAPARPCPPRARPGPGRGGHGRQPAPPAPSGPQTARPGHAGPQAGGTRSSGGKEPEIAAAAALSRWTRPRPSPLGSQAPRFSLRCFSCPSSQAVCFGPAPPRPRTGVGVEPGPGRSGGSILPVKVMDSGMTLSQKL